MDKQQNEFKEVGIIALCFWCGNKKHEIAKINIPKEAKKPKTGLVDYKPCPKCAAKMMEGIAVVEVTSYTFLQQPSIGEGKYPSGKWAVVELNFFDTRIDNADMLEMIKKSRRVLLNTEDYRNLGFDKEFKKLH